MPYLCLTLVFFSALQVAFGSLYRDDVLIKPSRVVALLAAACMLQLVSNKYAIFYAFFSDKDNSPDIHTRVLFHPGK